MLRCILLTGILLLGPPSNAGPQIRVTGPGIINLPQGSITRIPSPNRKWTLVFECSNDCAEEHLSIDDNVSPSRRLVKKFERHLDISWSPDSLYFFVNDAYASNESFCFVYDSITLKAADLSTLITRDDPSATPFFNAGHDYLQATRWLSSHELMVVLDGHFDETPPRGFTLRYRVDLTGKARRLSGALNDRRPPRRFPKSQALC